MMYTVYILECKKDSNELVELYVGQTNNLKRRILEHKQGRAGYTKRFDSIKCVYTETHSSRARAMKREYEIKKKGTFYKKKIIREQLTKEFGEF